MKKIINTSNAPLPVGPYNQAILIDKTLYMSGQIALDIKSKEIVNGTIEEETGAREGTTVARWNF